jgi:hypothetical protein
VDAAAREAEKGTSIGEVAVRHGVELEGEAEFAARRLWWQGQSGDRARQQP